MRDGELLAMTTVDLLIADAHRVLLCGNNSRLCCCWPKVGWLNRWKSHKRDGRESRPLCISPLLIPARSHKHAGL